MWNSLYNGNYANNLVWYIDQTTNASFNLLWKMIYQYFDMRAFGILILNVFLW